MSMQTNQKNKAADPSVKECANCGSIGAKLTCVKCKATHYCSKACQKQHWKNGHKIQCVTPEERRPRMVSSGADTCDRVPTGETDNAEGNIGECPICLDPFTMDGAMCTLPCKHEFHRECVEELRNQGVQQVCPLCRTALPPGAEQLFEDASRLYVSTAGRHRMREVSWKPQTASEKRNMAKVVEMWTSAANQGYAPAQFNLGGMYRSTSGVAQDYKKAMHWNRKAAEQGFAEAQTHLGIMYQNGEGVAQDFNEAMRWYRKATDQGDAKAQLNLGNMYNDGKGVAQDCKQAVWWYRQAAEQGDATAQHTLASIYRFGKGVTQDYTETARWLHKAADQGHVSAQFNLGTMYRDGDGITQDYNEALLWYRKAAHQGDANGQFNLGCMFNNGQGVSQDFNEAVRWYRKAADQGCVNAQLKIGIMYNWGRGVSQDFNEALRWYRKAADQGDAKAQYFLGIMYGNGDGVAKDFKIAHSFLSAAEAQGHESAHELRKRAEFSLRATSSECTGLNAAPQNQCACCGCGAENDMKLKPCPRCKGPLYCGKDCQRAHWKLEERAQRMLHSEVAEAKWSLSSVLCAGSTM